MANERPLYRKSQELRMYVRDDGMEGHETTAIKNDPRWRLKQTDGYDNGMITPVKSKPVAVPEFENFEDVPTSDEYVAVPSVKAKTTKGKYSIKSKVE